MELPCQQLELRGPPHNPDDEGPAWYWPALETLGSEHMDSDGFFTFAILIRLDLSEWTEGKYVHRGPMYSSARFKFKPVSTGFDVLLLDHRGSDRPQFEIRNEDWQPLLVRLVHDCREALACNPFETVDGSRSIGFDIRR